MRVFAIAIACTGCSSILGIDDFKVSDGGTPRDGMTDGVPPDNAPNCFGSADMLVCLPAAPSMPLDITAAQGANFNTDTSAACLAIQPPSWKMAGQPDACFLVGSSITINGDLVASGGRPLVLVASGMIQVNAQIDVAAHQTSTVRPPGAPFPQCPPPAVLPADNTQGAGGGAGATFMTRGGAGGMGNSGVVGGQPAQVATGNPTILRGGCAGGSGGSGGFAPVAGGMAGGAVYLVAGMRITIDRTINASGAGGNGSDSFGGGGGGGSGGMIVLHAPAITGIGAVMANGGGGGGGAGNQQGNPGSDPGTAAPLMQATGGQGGGGGQVGMGGFGFAGPNQATPGMSGSLSRGGGGGGGGAGFIRTNIAPGGQLVFTPNPTIVP